MALSANDHIARTRTIATTGTDAIAGPCTVYSVWCGSPSAASQVAINNAATAAGGGTTITVFALTDDTRQIDLGPTGVRFATGLSATPAGTGIVWGVTYIED
jgi:hypothetical protein